VFLLSKNPSSTKIIHTKKVFLWSSEAITGPWEGGAVVEVEEFEAAFQQQPVRFFCPCLCVFIIPS
jgi:hypothetical protein